MLVNWLTQIKQKVADIFLKKVIIQLKIAIIENCILMGVTFLYLKTVILMYGLLLM